MSLEIKFLPLTLDQLLACAAAHKNEGYRYVQMLCVTTDEGIDLQYSFMKDTILENYTIKGVTKETKVPSLTKMYLAAFMFENEAHELFGVDIEENVLDFKGSFYALSEREPMTVITPEQKQAREKAAKIKAAKEAKEAREAKKNDAELSTEKEGE